MAYLEIVERSNDSPGKNAGRFFGNVLVQKVSHDRKLIVQLLRNTNMNGFLFKAHAVNPKKTPPNPKAQGGKTLIYAGGGRNGEKC